MAPDSPKHGSDSGTLGIVIPAYNVEETIGDVVESCRDLAKIVIVVDDGSNDHTNKVASKYSAIVLRNNENMGLGFSLRRGILAARDAGAEYVITIDGDGVHDPTELVRILTDDEILKADLILGSRFIEIGHVPTTKRDANRFATSLCNAVNGTALSDVATGLRIIGPRFPIEVMSACRYDIANEFISTAVRNGLSIVETPIHVYYDYTELWATKRNELQDLLRSLDRGTALDAEIARIDRDVKDFERFRTTIGTDTFMAHPLHEYEAYIFQWKYY